MGGCVAHGTDSAASGGVVPCGSSAPAPAAGQCGLVCRAELPVQDPAGMATVTAWIGEQPATMMLDTGAAISSLTTVGAKRLGLAHTQAAPGRIWGIGGGQDRAMVQVARLAFGDVSYVSPQLPVLVMGRPSFGVLPDGGLGDDILHHYEVDLDFPHGTVRLYRGRPCAGPLPGWASEDAVLPWSRAFANGWQVAIPVTLDGQKLQALIDSGAETTVVGLPAALAAGVSQAELAGDLQAKMFGIGPGQVVGRLHRFDALAVGNQTVPGLESAVVGLPHAAFDMVLGADFLQAHKVWISYATGQVHVAHTW